MNGITRKDISITKKYYTMETCNKQLIFKDFSHITIRKTCHNFFIKRVKKGDVYNPLFDAEYPEEDLVKKPRWWNCYNAECVAKEDRWNCGCLGDGAWVSTVEEVIENWNGHVMYNKEEDKWYLKPWLEVTFLSGEKYKTYFDSDQEMEDYINDLLNNEVNQIGVND